MTIEQSFGAAGEPADEHSKKLEWRSWPERWIPAMYYASELFPRQLAEIPKSSEPIQIVDFGGGRGTLAHNLAMRAAGRMLSGYPYQSLKFTSYDPHQWAEPSMMELPPYEGELPIELGDSRELPERADIVTCHFSLHHTEDPGEVIRNEIAARLQPTFLTIMEFDFTSLPGDQSERLRRFEAVFTAANFGVESAEAQELKRFIHDADYDRELGLRRCYEFHQQFGTADYVRFLETSGYEVREAYRPAKAEERPTIILVGKRKSPPGGSGRL